MSWWKRNKTKLVGGVGNDWLIQKHSEGVVRITIVTPDQDLAFSVVLDQRGCGEAGRLLLHFSDFGQLPEDMLNEKITE